MEATPKESSFTSFCRLDSDDYIVEVGGEWDSFAKDNEGENAYSSNILSTWLYSHISGDAVRMFTDTLLQRVRVSKKDVIKPYRCDSIDTKRFMEMKLSLDKDGNVLMQHRQIFQETMPCNLRWVATESTNDPIYRCSMCNQIGHKNKWYEPDQAWKKNILTSEQVNPVIYTVCQNCQSNLCSDDKAHTHTP